jgi:N-methylhydantoinase A/oxoprolinase/acetone carboxylase beta subunit
MGYSVGIDVGGTFTDLFALDGETGSVVADKADTSEDGTSSVLDVLARSGIDPREIRSLVLGTTLAINALVEGRTRPVAFLGTAGFTDILEIRRVWRQHLFGWQWERPKSLVPHGLRFGIRGRIDWEGREIEPLEVADVDRAVAEMRRRDVRTAAVSLLFSFANPDHERAVERRIAELAPDITVVASSDVNPEIKEYERASTTVIAAKVMTLVNRLLAELEERLRSHGVTAPPQVIKSNGAVMSFASARAKPWEILRSGPAGGVASARSLSRALHIPNLIAVDIGGTTADVSVVSDGEVASARQAELAWDIPIRVAMADVRSIGAGGGSIAWLDRAGRLQRSP